MIIHTHTTSHYIKKTSITIIKSTLSIIDNNEQEENASSRRYI